MTQVLPAPRAGAAGFLVLRPPSRDRNPAAVYLARLAPRSRRALQAALDRIAAELTSRVRNYGWCNSRGAVSLLGGHLAIRAPLRRSCEQPQFSWQWLNDSGPADVSARLDSRCADILDDQQRRPEEPPGGVVPRFEYFAFGSTNKYTGPGLLGDRARFDRVGSRRRRRALVLAAPG